MKQKVLALLLVFAMVVIPTVTALAAPEEMFDVKFSGVIETVPAADAGSPAVWQIAGMTVKTTDGTLLKVFGADAAAAGMWADVTAKRTGENELTATKLFVVQPTVRLVGPLTAMPGKTGAWVVAGVTVNVTEDTVTSERAAPIVVGGWVEVHAVADTTGALTAVRVLGVTEREEVEIWGAIEAVSETEVTVSGITVAVTADTKVMGTPKVGLLAQVFATVTETGLSAKRITVAWLEPKRGQGPAQFTGKIEALPASGLVGTWTVAGRQVEVSNQTKVMQFKGLAEVGATVLVVGKTNGDVVDAFMVVVLSSPTATKPFIVAGLIQALPESGVVGQWKVNGVTFDVTATTKIDGTANVKLGALAFVQGVETADGKVATWVKVKAMRDAAVVNP